MYIIWGPWPQGAHGDHGRRGPPAAAPPRPDGPTPTPRPQGAHGPRPHGPPPAPRPPAPQFQLFLFISLYHFRESVAIPWARTLFPPKKQFNAIRLTELLSNPSVFRSFTSGAPPKHVWHEVLQEKSYRADIWCTRL